MQGLYKELVIGRYRVNCIWNISILFDYKEELSIVFSKFLDKNNITYKYTWDGSVSMFELTYQKNNINLMDRLCELMGTELKLGEYESRLGEINFSAKFEGELE